MFISHYIFVDNITIIRCHNITIAIYFVSNHIDYVETYRSTHVLVFRRFIHPNHGRVGCISQVCELYTTQFLTTIIPPEIAFLSTILCRIQHRIVSNMLGHFCMHGITRLCETSYLTYIIE